MTAPSRDLLTRFRNYFSVKPATTDAEREAIYRIRYRVYCDEFGYEPKERFPSQMETDELDAVATHLLITHLASGMPAACMRICPASDQDQPLSLPFEKRCEESLDLAAAKRFSAPRGQMCEASRFAVDSAFRRRPGECASPIGEIASLSLSDHEQRTFPLLTLVLTFAAVAMAELLERPLMYAVMDPFLPRLLKRSGLVFVRIGRDADYHGTRAVYVTDTRFAVHRLDKEMQTLYWWVHDQLAPNMLPANASPRDARWIADGSTRAADISARNPAPGPFEIIEQSSGLLSSFRSYFSVQAATTDAEREAAYRIRYRVYCDEFGYEPRERFPSRMETDELDAVATHLLINHFATDMPAGCMRICPASDQGQPVPLPLEKCCHESLDLAATRFSAPREQICEASRFAVDSAFRRRSGERLSRFGEIASLSLSDHERRTFPLLTLVLMFTGVATAELLERPFMYALMEPFLPRLLKRFGLVFVRMGRDVNYHGTRAVYITDTRFLVHRLDKEMEALYRWVHDQLASSTRRKGSVLAMAG